MQENERQKGHCLANLATFVVKIKWIYFNVRFQNGFNKVVIELRVKQFWSEIILVISNRTRAGRLFDFEITSMISDQIALHSVPITIVNFHPKETCFQYALIKDDQRYFQNSLT